MPCPVRKRQAMMTILIWQMEGPRTRDIGA